MSFLVPADLNLWPLTLTFKLMRVRDQTRLPCEFGAHRLSVSRAVSCTQKSHRQRQKQNLTQFTACGKNVFTCILTAWRQSRDCRYTRAADWLPLSLHGLRSIAPWDSSGRRSA